MPRIMIAGFLTLIVIFSISVAQEPTGVKDGSQAYLPSQMEWLILNMNARVRVARTEANGFSLDFWQGDDPNTLIVSVMYNPKVNRRLLNMTVNHAKKMAIIFAKNRKWDTWLRIEEDVQMEAE